MDRKRLFSHFLFVLFLAFPFLQIFAARAGITSNINIQNPGTINLTLEDNANEIPVRLVITNTNISLNVSPSEINGGTWYMHSESASYAIGSSYLNEPLGNAILFAHSVKPLFRNLSKIHVGDEISIMGTGEIYTYKVKSIEETDPEMVENIKSVGETNLTVFTCAGENDERRLIVKAKKIESSKYGYEGVI